MRDTRGGARVAVAVAAVTALVFGCQERAGLEREAIVPVTPSQEGPYTQEEWALYREAVERLERFERENQRFLAAGEANPEAESFYRDHLRDWEQDYALLKTYEHDRIRIKRRPVVLSSEPASIRTFRDGAADIVVSRCIDASDREMTQDGLLVPWEHDEPVLQEVAVHRYENRSWVIGTVKTTDEPCLG
jgi:hypothetical protein